MKLFSLLSMVYALTGTTASTQAGGALSGLTFEPMNFISMLAYMGKGMLVIFVLIGVIILVTLLINKIFSRKKKD